MSDVKNAIERFDLYNDLESIVLGGLVTAVYKPVGHLISMDVPIRGKPKSGRVWKSVRTKKHSSMKKDKGLRTPFELRRKREQQLKRIRDLDAERKKVRADGKREKRLREEENRKRKSENERRAEIVVPVKNTNKIKRMKKSQLRNITTR